MLIKKSVSMKDIEMAADDMLGMIHGKKPRNPELVKEILHKYNRQRELKKPEINEGDELDFNNLDKDDLECFEIMKNMYIKIHGDPEEKMRDDYKRIRLDTLPEREQKILRSRFGLENPEINEGDELDFDNLDKDDLESFEIMKNMYIKIHGDPEEKNKLTKNKQKTNKNQKS